MRGSGGCKLGRLGGGGGVGILRGLRGIVGGVDDAFGGLDDPFGGLGELAMAVTIEKGSFLPVSKNAEIAVSFET